MEVRIGSSPIERHVLPLPPQAAVSVWAEPSVHGPVQNPPETDVSHINVPHIESSEHAAPARDGPLEGVSLRTSAAPLPSVDALGTSVPPSAGVFPPQ
jgi:hypothetical protein